MSVPPSQELIFLNLASYPPWDRGQMTVWASALFSAGGESQLLVYSSILANIAIPLIAGLGKDRKIYFTEFSIFQNIISCILLRLASNGSKSRKRKTAVKDHIVPSRN